ncbi:cytoplasmic protein [Coprinopsis sp. MPI-PUGE-AT-0042]|nr:cytoplasmic protein [Coprinopsis sp. MPI-PUGE-AT-0042]
MSRHQDDTASIAESFTSNSSRKTRPESLLMAIPTGSLILGVGLVDFNHLVGPRVEWSTGEIFEDEELAKIMPFLALPDGAHMSAEDYSYFHIVQPGPQPTTIFGISCNQQLAASLLINKPADVTRSTVQKAVVVLASKPVFGPIREKLRIVTTALFSQRDFSDYSILDDFASTLELSLQGQLTESVLYVGTNLRELVHTFRQKTLILLKALIMQKRIMFYGYPVERLCTFQYSLVSLIPGLLQNLDDCGSPPLANRAQALTRPNSLKTSDRKSMMAFMGLPLDVFGQDALFQPYLPLQQLDMLRNTPSWLCGCTNSIVTQQKEIDLLVQADTGVFEFRDPQLERSAGLTAADRKWMDEIITDVNEGWGEDDPSRPHGMKFKGSDDYLRAKFEEYLHAALSTVKYRDFVLKGDGGGVLIAGGVGSDANNAAEDFNPLWISEFKKTKAFEVWERVTDPLLFDIVEPRHPCNEKPSVVADIGLRLQEGIQDLKLEQQLAPAREAVASALATGSTNLFKAVEGVRERWAQRSASSGPGDEGPKTATQANFLRPFSFTPKTFSLAPAASSSTASPPNGPSPSPNPNRTSTSSTASAATSPNPSGATSPLSGWGANIGSFFSEKASRISMAARQSSDDVGRRGSADSGATGPPATSMSQSTSALGSGAGGPKHDPNTAWANDAEAAAQAEATRPPITKSLSNSFSSWGSSLSALVSSPPAAGAAPLPGAAAPAPGPTTLPSTAPASTPGSDKPAAAPTGGDADAAKLVTAGSPDARPAGTSTAKTTENPGVGESKAL